MRSAGKEMPMPWIEALKYGLTALAALFGFWAAVKVKAQGQAPTEQGTRLIERFMLFCLGLLLASVLLALYEGFFFQQSPRMKQTRQIISRIDEGVGRELNVENDAFAALDSHSKQVIDNLIRSICREIVELDQIVSSNAPPHCKARLERPPGGSQT
jgi:hypothetical protein